MRTAIALGSNLGDRLANLTAGRDAVLRLAEISAGALFSRVYEADPVGTGSGSARFLNAVMEIEFVGEPTALLARLRGIEASMGRPSRHPRNAPRTLDLDILYVGNVVKNSDALVLPHPRLHLRRFVLTPLNDIRPEHRLPGFAQTIAKLLRTLDDPASVELFARQW